MNQPTETPLQRFCIYCGSSPGARPEYAEAAKTCGTLLATRGIEARKKLHLDVRVRFGDAPHHALGAQEAVGARGGGEDVPV